MSTLSLLFLLSSTALDGALYNARLSSTNSLCQTSFSDAMPVGTPARVLCTLVKELLALMAYVKLSLVS